METRVYAVPGAGCWHRVAQLTSRISLVLGVVGVSVESAGTDRAEFRVICNGWVPPERIRAAIREAGYEVTELVGREATARATAGLPAV